jgi:hypothetical protein
MTYNNRDFSYYYICIELPDKAREVVVLEIVRKEITSKLRWSPNNESSVIFTPRNYMVSGWIIYQLIGFGKEGSWD